MNEQQQQALQWAARYHPQVFERLFLLPHVDRGTHLHTRHREGAAFGAVTGQPNSVFDTGDPRVLARYIRLATAFGRGAGGSFQARFARDIGLHRQTLAHAALTPRVNVDYRFNSQENRFFPFQATPGPADPNWLARRVHVNADIPTADGTDFAAAVSPTLVRPGARLLPYLQSIFPGLREDGTFPQPLPPPGALAGAGAHAAGVVFGPGPTAGRGILEIMPRPNRRPYASTPPDTESDGAPPRQRRRIVGPIPDPEAPPHRRGGRIRIVRSDPDHYIKVFDEFLRDSPYKHLLQD